MTHNHKAQILIETDLININNHSLIWNLKVVIVWLFCIIVYLTFFPKINNAWEKDSLGRRLGVSAKMNICTDDPLTSGMNTFSYLSFNMDCQ